MELDARFELVPHGLRFVVDVEGARYPITIDPLAQQGYLKASNTGVDDGFGYAVAVSGDTIVVGAWNEDSSAAGVNGNQSDNSVSNAGAAYVFVRNGTTWSQQAYLKASNPDVGDEFGYPVGISGDTIVVGARLESSDATGVNGAQNNNNASLSGAAYVFVRNGTTWSQQAYLKASNSEANDVFGSTVAISGDTVVVGTASERSNATGVNGNQADNSLVGAGAAYVFARSGTTWSQQAYLKASNTGSIDQFGHSLAISGDTIAVGAVGEASNATGVNGNQLDNSASGSGAVYVFARSGTTWSQQAYVKASNPDVGDTFGRSVAVSGSTLVVGAEGESSNATGVNGNQANNASGRSGAAYVFVRNGTTWSQQAYLKASNNGLQDEFGGSVAASGDLVLVGAVGEGSNATGVNGNQLDNSLFAAGAAYLFTRSGTTWSQHSYLKASNTASSDTFGVRVAIDGTTCVIGAFGEDSNATGVNGNQASNSASGSGAAYTHFLDDGPVVFCAGDGSGVPCPCAASLAGNGCPNNVNAGGAHLSATGTASLGIDSLVLHGTGMNNGPCFYFQGDARENGGLGVVFGDGIRCVTGNVIAFPAKLNVLGASQYPGLGDASISIAGAVGVPGQKHYQCVYRSANPSFCTPSTLNYTTALSVTWGL
ncbi:MAG: FG-GAP repeat protein [Planctomycetes bacterium]|nr:FG-GAP repeat protein [Planctomycetota bacterium]